MTKRVIGASEIMAAFDLLAARVGQFGVRADATLTELFTRLGEHVEESQRTWGFDRFLDGLAVEIHAAAARSVLPTQETLAA